MEAHANAAIKYSPIRLSSLKGSLSIPFDVYVKVSDKYILYCRAQQAIEGERLDRLRSKRLSHVYILSEDLMAYTRYTQARITQAYDSSKELPLQQRCNIILGALQSVTEELIGELDDSSKFNVVQEGARRLGQFLNTEPEALKILLSFNNPEQNLAQHGVQVAALAFVLAEHLGYRESKALKMPMFMCACLIHDLEHHFTNINLSIPYEELSESEKDLYETHGQKGAERLLQYNFYDPLIVEIIQYHETNNAAIPLTGKKAKDLDPLIAVVATANTYDHLVSKLQMSPRDALKKMLIDEMGSLPLECLKGLQEVLKKRIF